MAVPATNVHASIFPKKGDIVSFSYDNFSPNGVPYNMQVGRIRADLNWQEVLFNYERENKGIRISLQAFS